MGIAIDNPMYEDLVCNRGYVHVFISLVLLAFRIEVEPLLMAPFGRDIEAPLIWNQSYCAIGNDTIIKSSCY